MRWPAWLYRLPLLLGPVLDAARRGAVRVLRRGAGEPRVHARHGPPAARRDAGSGAGGGAGDTRPAAGRGPLAAGPGPDPRGARRPSAGGAGPSVPARAGDGRRGDRAGAADGLRQRRRPAPRRVRPLRRPQLHGVAAPARARGPHGPGGGARRCRPARRQAGRDARRRRRRARPAGRSGGDPRRGERPVRRHRDGRADVRRRHRRARRRGAARLLAPGAPGDAHRSDGGPSLRAGGWCRRAGRRQNHRILAQPATR